MEKSREVKPAERSSDLPQVLFAIWIFWVFSSFFVVSRRFSSRGGVQR